MTRKELAAAVAVVVRAWHLPRRMYVELEPLLGCSLKRDFGVALCVACNGEYVRVRSDQRFCSKGCKDCHWGEVYYARRRDAGKPMRARVSRHRHGGKR